MRPYSQPPSLKPEASAVYTEIFDFVPSRVQRRMVQIMEGAIKTCVKYGVEGVTYDAVAKASKVSRPLIQHYFESKHDLFEMVMKYIRANFQEIAVQAIQKESKPEKQLEAYIGALFVWIKKYPVHAKVWNLTYYYAAVEKGFRKLHTDLAMMGHKRITALLEAGAAQGVFEKGDYPRRAKMIQTLYTGALITVTTEDLYVDADIYKNHLTSCALNISKNK